MILTNCEVKDPIGSHCVELEFPIHADTTTPLFKWNGDFCEAGHMHYAAYEARQNGIDGLLICGECISAEGWADTGEDQYFVAFEDLPRLKWGRPQN